MTARVLLFTCFALLCFAGNSLLCRLALASREIDAASFTAIRLASGAGVLALLARPRAERATLATGAERATLRTGSWLSALALFAYAAPFSFSYLSLGAALGALVLFGAVQVTMVGWGILRGERPSALAWLGMALALAGLLGLTWPGRSAPQLMGVVPMIVAGVSPRGIALATLSGAIASGVG